MRGKLSFLTLIALTAVSLTAGCSMLTFIEDRLDPPEPVSAGMIFRYKAEAARQVNLAGEFNNWLGTQNGGRLDPNIDPMNDANEDGIWEITLPLPPGRYRYKFLIDQVDWQEDPANPETTEDGFGGLNSVLVVPSNVAYAYDESYISHALDTGSRSRRRLQYVFELPGFADATAVHLTGEFANWDPSAVPMDLQPDGVWRTVVELQEGDHPYKYVVDGAWMEDPNNPDSVDDGLGGKNSVAHVRR